MDSKLFPDEQTLYDLAAAQFEAEIERGRNSVKSHNDWVSEEEMLAYFDLPATGKRAANA